MIIVNVITSPVANGMINLGKQGENKAREVWFDLSWLIDTYGAGTATVLHQRPTDAAPYLVTLTQEGKIAAWKVGSLDTAYDGFGKCELRWSVSDTLAKTIVYKTTIQKSMTQDAVMPNPYESWYDQMISHIDGITDRIENSDAEVETLEPTEDATADVQFSAEGLHFSFGIPRGQDGLPGKDGADGQDGYTPVKGVDYFDGQDGAPGKDGKDGADGYTPIKGVDYTDGKDGKDGLPGKDGVDGHSPVVTASKSGKVTTVSVDGTPIATINDGADGAVDSVNGKTGVVVLDAEDVGALPDSTVIPSKTSQLQNDSGYGTYSKPSGGIPKSDLASTVQNSLGKADTALQSYTETDPTVPAWAKASTKPVYTASEVGAIALPVSPSSGDFLVYNGSAWVAQTLATWQGGNY